MGFSRNILRGMVLGLIFLSLHSVLSAAPGFVNPDTVFLAKGQYIIFRDSSFYAKQDTLLCLPDSVFYLTEDQQLRSSASLYDSISDWAKEKKWINNILKILIVHNASAAHSPKSETDKSVQLEPFQGMQIRKIRLARLDVFGPGINDTAFSPVTGMQKFLNNTHVNSRSVTIRRNLLIKSGDKFDVAKIRDNERILRGLPFIKDAKIIVVPISTNVVDLLVITQDQYSLGMELSPRGLETGNVSIFESNFLGFGHRLEAKLLYDLNKDPSIGFQGSYIFKNLLGSFMEAGAIYTSAFENQSIRVFGHRDFITPDTKYSFGMENNVVHTTENFDTSLSVFPLRYNYIDYWAGRAIKINTQRDRIILSTRFINNNVYERPEIEESEYHRLQRYWLILGSLGYSREDFFKANMIYNFGRTEDIPTGFLVNLTGGFENNEFAKRFYAGIDFSYGSFLENFGYLYFKTSSGGFINHQDFTRGITQLDINYFSSLFKVRRFQLRQFINAGFTRGIDRFADEKLYLNDKLGIRGLSSDSLSGTQRFTLNFETVMFSPFNLYGFRFAFYTFADLGIIGNSSDPLFDKKLYSGFGLGVRVRNENLSFNTLQIRLGFYPLTPPDFNPELIQFSGEKYYQPKRFNQNRPEIQIFR